MLLYQMLNKSNVLFLKTYKNEFDDFIVTLTKQNGKPLNIEDNLI